MSLFSTLNVGARALQTSQLAIDITGQNMANADVEGYSRKRLNIATMYCHDTIFGQIGMGASVINIERVRNIMLDEQIRKQNTEVGYFAQVTTTFMRMETLLTEPSDFGVMNTIDEFFNQWHNLSNNPADLSARTMVMSDAQSMIEHFRKAAQELADLRQQKDDEIPMKLNRVNQITQEIYNLNLEVAAVEIKNQNANDSRDKREQLLKELGGLIDIAVVENTNGQVTVTAGGSVLVAPTYRQELEATTIFREQPDGTMLREVGIRFSNTRQSYIPKGGEIRGLMDSRDVYIPEYQQKLDELALAIIKSVNELHVDGYSLHGYSGIYFFDESVLTKDEDGNLITFNAARKIALAPAITEDVRNIAAATAGQDRHTTSYAMSPTPYGANPPTYIHNFGNEPVQLYRDGIIPNPDDPLDPVNEQARRANNLIMGTVTIKTASGANPPDVVLKEGIDYHLDYENGTFQMLHDGYDDVELDVKFDYFVGGFKGPGDNSNALAISELRTKMTMTPNALGENTATYAEFVSAVIGRLGVNVNQAGSNFETRSFLMLQYETQQDMVAGVSMDEEIANMVKFQHTYTAAARLISTIDEMLQVLLNM